MSKYKTWEVIKMLGKNPNLRFETKDEKYGIKQIISSTEFGDLHLECVGCSDEISDNIGINEEWELVKKPVSFMEAIKAYKKGKTIRCEFEDVCTIYEPETSIDCNYCPMVDNDGDAFCAAEILNGKWYIEEEVM